MPESKNVGVGDPDVEMVMTSVDADADSGMESDADSGMELDADSGMELDAGADSDMNGGLCEKNEHVSDHQCVNCSPGFTRPSGDDPQGDDTSCVDACEPVFGAKCDALNTRYLKASNAELFDGFGQRVVFDGDTLAVSAPGEDSDATGINNDQNNNERKGSGAVYIFTRTNGVWTQQAYIKQSIIPTGYYLSNEYSFGESLALSKDTLVVGALERKDNAVYVFVRNGEEWVQQAYFKSPNIDEDNFFRRDYFGFSVAVFENTLVVGDPYKLDKETMTLGGAYIFQRDEDTHQWSEYTYLTNPLGAHDAFFGGSVAVSNNTVAIGAPRSNSVFVYTYSKGVWSDPSNLSASNLGNGDYFGDELALSGDTLIVGAPRARDDSADSYSYQGAVYVFTRSEDEWMEEAYIKPSMPKRDSWFGSILALSEDGRMFAVGSSRDEHRTQGIEGLSVGGRLENAGAVYVFVRTRVGGWEERLFVQSPKNVPEDTIGGFFGSSVAFSGNTLVVGAPKEDGSSLDDSTMRREEDSGAVFVWDVAP